MVKIGRIFTKRGGKDSDEASVYSKSVYSKKFGKKSPSPAPSEVVTTTTPVSLDLTPTSPLSPRSFRKKSEKKKSKSPDPIASPSPSNVEEEEDARDEAPAAVNESPADPVGRDETVAEPLLDSISAPSADEASFEETVESSEEASQAYDEVESYEEEEEEEEEEESFAGTTDEVSYGDETAFADDTATQQDPDNTVFGGRSLGVKGQEASKKYFHKDVVLNSLEDGANNLVIRAMYFIPKPKAEDHVVVKIEASTISARDCMKCKGHGLTRSMLPFVPGYQVVGTIQTLGDKAKAEGQFREGDRVAGVSTFGGGNSRFISIPAVRLTKISNNVKSTQAVCMIDDYMAALKALRLAKKSGSPITGMNILITDGFSPVGQATINLANMEGANIYCCADESKHSYLASLGVKCFVKNPEVWLPTATGTFDVVIDNSCIDSYTSSWFALNQKGSLVVIAPVYNIDNDDLPAASCGVVDIVELKQKWAGMKARYVMTQTSFLNTETCYDEDMDQYKQDLRYLMFLLERGDVKPKVAERVSLDDVPDAQRLMQSGRANGTVVCVPWIEG